jgi:hypothetical protein
MAAAEWCRSPDGAKRNPGSPSRTSKPLPDYAALHPGHARLSDGPDDSLRRGSTRPTRLPGQLDTLDLISAQCVNDSALCNNFSN